MDYKEKYEMALEGIQEILGSGADSIKMSRLQLRLQGIFPELKESEDDRIRREMIEIIKNEAHEFPSSVIANKSNSWIAWLEKQGEQNPKHFELKAGHWYICHHAYCCRADNLTVKEGERFMCEKDGVVKGFVVKEPEEYFKEVCAPAPIEFVQKPAWSEEDEKNLEGIICEIEADKYDAPDYDIATYDRFLSWLKSIKERVQL